MIDPEVLIACLLAYPCRHCLSSDAIAFVLLVLLVAAVYVDESWKVVAERGIVYVRKDEIGEAGRWDLLHYKNQVRWWMHPVNTYR